MLLKGWYRLIQDLITREATISKLEEALWISHRKYDALWGWEMLKLLVHYVLQTRMRQRFQKVLHCFQKAFNEVVPLTNLKETILFFNFRCVIRRVVRLTA